MSNKKKQYQVLKRSTIKGCLWRFAALLSQVRNDPETVRSIIAQIEEDIDQAAVPPEWLSESQVAAQYPLGVKTLQQLRHEGRGPAYHKLSRSRNGRVVYKRLDIEIYLAKCRIETEDQVG
ncbi:Helix-turn-helix domain-containing protein [Sulfidibacter corallicola]|uniref:Helix-turn-helix domain-containing protein n=1 Tax=Sulfidibacter corallicola TaxID=2818388 RepID=A0A8A4TF67_SULCO|nr:helix-turn-helix domain-containing protein [Sulfidibacter corallicola]QTD48596.1 helix-turn-helix domain-containing protein [Sulfidibacter corallicola]